MLKGVNQQQIFYDSEDNENFLQILKDCKTISGFELYAYCLMGNHIHLLIITANEPIEQIMKRIGTRFVYWYNLKYQRSGHLFQDRYKIEPVENDEYFLSVLKYIHNNPVKSKQSKSCSDYKYSSYNDFFDNKGIIDSKFVFGILPLEQFSEFHKIEDCLKHIDVEENPVKRITDEEAIKTILKKSHCKNIEEFFSLPESRRKVLHFRIQKEGYVG